MKKMNNKGFSLIELIIVIAIMAVLVAIIAPNLTKYLGSSKKGADDTNREEVRKQTKNCIAEAGTKDISIISSGTTATYNVLGTGTAVTVTNAGNGTADFAKLLQSVFDSDMKTKEKAGNHKAMQVSITGSESDGYTV
ncbi:MAG: type II secretion system GspH family protein, partial [Lachnospiraceae bacterium]|nr:type II secretion system GspH family protein [Lachnospiraceae bacterium]